MLGTIIIALFSFNPSQSIFIAREEYEALVKAGVIDPAKVTHTALQNAASIAALMLTTEALISEIPEAKSSAPAMPGGGGMDGGF